MSRYSEYRYDFTSSINRLKEIDGVLDVLKLAKRKREEPVPKHVTNLKANINLANEMVRLAKQNYDTAFQELKVSNIIPIGWLPTFDELKEIVETVEPRDR